MKINDKKEFSSTLEFTKNKISRYEKEEKNFETFFDFMFSERENVFSEIADGYKIKKLTYGECADKIRTLSTPLSKALADLPKGSLVGFYMSNSSEWVELFWAILMCGYRPLLMNARMTDDLLERILSDYSVKAVISDGKSFSVNTYEAKDIFAADTGEIYTPDVWGTEVIFMSSGTTDNVKLCAYTAENFYYQVCDSVGIVENCPEIAMRCEGEIKLLALLPFYHVFGFIAVYMWFSFFSCTFVFLKDAKPQTLLMSIQKHKVTHIFAVPLVWETIYKEAMRKIRARGDKTYRKFLRVLKLANRSPALGNMIAGKAFAEIRQNLFGDSIRFMISGGSDIKPEILEFFNGIGYCTVNGYGMTEVGITSVEMSGKRSVRNKASIGYPIKCTEYSISEKGELLVRGRTMASRVLQNGEEKVTDFDEWFNTHDLVTREGDRYYLHGRRDDLVVCENGENLNPEIIEKALYVNGVNRICLFADKNGTPTLIISIIDCFSEDKLKHIYADVLEKLRENKLNDEIKNVVVTTDKLLMGGDFKLSRKKVAKRYEEGVYNIVDLQHTDKYIQQKISELEGRVIACFAEALQIDASEIGVNDDFFTDLGGSSLNYFALADLLKENFGTDVSTTESLNLTTVKAFCEYIENN